MTETSPDGLRYRKKQKTRLAVERAALELVIEHGYDGVTVEDICARAEISKKTFFNYFSSKSTAITGHMETFPDDEKLCEILKAHEAACYVDVLVGVLAADFVSSADKQVISLRREALRSMPQLFFRGQRDALVAQRSIAAALRVYLAEYPQHRMMPDRPLEHEVLVASSTVIGLSRTRFMLYICSDKGPSAEETRHLLVEYLSRAEK